MKYREGSNSGEKVLDPLEGTNVGIFSGPCWWKPEQREKITDIGCVTTIHTYWKLIK